MTDQNTTNKKSTAPTSCTGKGAQYLKSLDLFGLPPLEARKLLESLNGSLDATVIKAVWNYRAKGLKIDEAREAIRMLMHPRHAPRERRKIRGSKTEYHRYAFAPRAKDYLQALEASAELRRRNLDDLRNATAEETVSNISEALGDWRLGKVKLRIGSSWVLLTRHESAYWGSDYKPGRYPQSRSVSYTACLIDSAGNTVNSTKFKARHGDWLSVVGKSLRLPVGERTALTQSAAMIPVASKTYGSIKVTTLRLFGNGPAQLVAEGFGTNFHASTPREAVAGLIVKLRKIRRGQAGRLDDRDILSRDDAEAAGFCPHGTESFLEAIGFAGRECVRVAEIRKAMEGTDVSPWESELRQIGLT